jgi:hypothetical protein
MGQSDTSETNRQSAFQEILHLLFKLKIHPYAQQSNPPTSILFLVR